MTSATKQKAMAVLVPLLAIALVFVVLRVFGSTPTKTAKARRSESAKTIGDSNDVIGWQIPAPYPATLRDPMLRNPAADAEVKSQTQQTGRGESEELIVKGIVYSKDDPVAIVGTAIVHEGDKVSGATVVSIGRDSIEFEMNGKRWVQRVQQQTESPSDVPKLETGHVGAFQ